MEIFIYNGFNFPHFKHLRNKLLYHLQEIDWNQDMEEEFHYHHPHFHFISLAFIIKYVLHFSI